MVTGNLVGTSNSASATFAPFQRKTFYAKGRFWVFYASGYSIYYSSSVDGVNWATPTFVEGLQYNYGESFDLHFDGTYVHLTWIYGNELRYKRGTPNSDGTITWGDIQYVLKRAFRSDENYDSDYLTLRKTLVSGNIYQLDIYATGVGEDYTTEVNIGSYGAGNKFVFTPYATVTTPVGTTLPTTIQLKGWMAAIGGSPVKETAFEGRFQASIKVKNPDAIAHAGNLYARLWVSDNPDMSGAVALTGWAYTSVSFSGTAGETKTVTINLDVNKAVGDAYAFKSKYFYIELLWDVTTAARNARVQIEGNYATSSVYPPQTTPAYYFKPKIMPDSNGYPYIGCGVINGIAYYPYVFKGNANDGTWNWRLASARKLSTTYDLFWVVNPLGLTAGKMLVIYGYSSYVYYTYWDGTSWTAGTSFPGTPASLLYCSFVVHADTVEMVWLEDSTWDIEHSRWTPNAWSSVATIIHGTTSTSAPVLAIDNATGNLYVFAATKTTGSPSGWTAEHIYYAKYDNATGAWSPWTDWLDESAELLYSADRLTCFYQAGNSYIGIAYMTKTASPYNVKFAFLTLIIPVYRYIGDGLTGATIIA
jgi:hypothetical protein